MSGAVSLGTALAVGAGAAAVSQMVMKPKGQATPKVAEPEPPPQAAQAPDQSARRSQQAAAGGGFVPGSTSTMLTDAAGVDPSELLLGKNTLLGQ